MLAVLQKNSESAGWEPDGWEKWKHNDKQKVIKKSRCSGGQNSIKENMIQNALWREYTYCRLKKHIWKKITYYSLSPSDLILDLLPFYPKRAYAQTSVGNLATSWPSTFQRVLILYLQTLAVSATSICNGLLIVISVKLHFNI